MPEVAVNQPATPPAAPANRVQINAEIRSLATIAGLDDTFANDQIDRQATVEQARAAAFEAMQQRSGGPIRTATISAGPSNDDPAVVVERMAEALVCRLRGGKPSEQARPYMQRRLVDMAGELLTRRGERGVSMMTPDQIFTRAGGMHTTSDFPGLLTSTGNRLLMPAYEAAASPVKALARPTTISDFRAKTSLRLGAMPKLEKVLESGEITHTTRSEAKEAYSLATFARIFSLSRHAMINDDLGAFNDWAAAMGRAAAETEASELVALLVANSGVGPTMDDGKALFHADHGNLAGSGTAIDTTNLGVGRKAMRDQVGLAGEPINVAPKFLLVSSTKETQAESVLASIYAATPEDANLFSGRLTLAVEPRLAGNPWYLFADPALAPVLEYAYLTAAPGPQVSMREGWEVLGAEFRVVLDFGCGVVDHRGAYRNPGA